MNRLLGSLKASILAALPTIPYWVPRRFRVIQMHAGDNRVELQAIQKSLLFPDVLPISINPGMAGLWAKLTPGTVVVVQFVDGDPSLPIVTHFAAPDDGGFLPLELYLDASSKVTIGASAGVVEIGGEDTVADPTGRFVRWGDSVVFPAPGIGLLVPTPALPTAKVKTP